MKLIYICMQPFLSLVFKEKTHKTRKEYAQLKEQRHTLNVADPTKILVSQVKVRLVGGVVARWRPHI